MSLIGKLENDFKSKFIARTEAINLIAKTENDNICNAIRLILHFGIADKLEMFTLDEFKLEAHGEDDFKNEYLLRNNFFNEWVKLNSIICDYHKGHYTDGYTLDYAEKELFELWEFDNVYWLKDDFFSNQDVRNILKLDEPYQDETQKTNSEYEPLQDYADFLEIKRTPKQYPLFYKNDFFDLRECESMITGSTPDNDWKNAERVQAYNLVLASVHNGKFKPHPFRENDYLISANDFREWLISKDIFIDGFTNISNQGKFTTQSQICETNPIQAPITELEQQLHSEIDRLKTELEQAQTLLAEKLADKQNIELAQSVDEPLHPKLKTSHEKLIAVLASMAELDFNKPFSNYDSLCLKAELLGMDNFLNKDTLAKLLNNAHKHINNSK